MYDIELEPPEIDRPCQCCDDRPVRLTRFVIKDGDARGAYFGLYSNKHADQGVHIQLSLGPWWDGSRAEERSCFYFRLFPEESSSSLAFGDVERSPWGPVDVMGAPFTREEARLHPLKQELFELHGRIAEADPSVRGFFERARSGDASVPLERRYLEPDPIFTLSAEEKDERARVDGDFASLGGSRFFARALLPIPVEELGSWDVATWCEIPRSDFKALLDVWDQPDDYARFSCEGKLANDCADVEASGYLDAAVTIAVRDADQLPIVISSDDPRLAARLAGPWSEGEFRRFAVEKGFL